MPNYTKSWSKKQWTRTTEGVFKNIIDALREGKALPKGYIMPVTPVEEGFNLTVEPTEWETPSGKTAQKAFMVCVWSIRNWAGTVNLSQSNNLCGGSSVTLDESSISISAQTPTNCAVMRAGIPDTCPAGTYSITVMGISGSIKRQVTVEIKVGQGGPPPPPPPPPGRCNIDAECKGYGDDWWCVNGQCLKACGTALANCNSDYCAEGENCIWSAAEGKCLCMKGNAILACPSEVLILIGSGKTAYSQIVIASVNGLSGPGSIVIYDAGQPSQAVSDCATGWLEYGSQSGNIIPFTLPADGYVTIGVVFSSNCDAAQTHYFGVEVTIGAKVFSCIIALKVGNCPEDESGMAYVTYVNVCGCCPEDCVPPGGCQKCWGYWSIVGKSSGHQYGGVFDLDHLYGVAVSEAVPVHFHTGEELQGNMCAQVVCGTRKGTGPDCTGPPCTGDIIYIIKTNLGNEANMSPLPVCGNPNWKTLSGKWCE